MYADGMWFLGCPHSRGPPRTGSGHHVGSMQCIVLCKTVAAYVCAKLLAMIAFLSAAHLLTNVHAFAPICALILHLNLRLNFAP